MEPSAATLQRAVAGDRHALRRVVDDWIRPIRRWALIATGDPVLAEDVVQESLVRLIRAIHTYDPARPFGPWLKTLVTNTARTELGRLGRAVPPPDAPEPEPAGRRLDLAQAYAAAREAFAALPARQREIIHLVDLQGLSPSEVAKALGLSAGAVRGQLFQARRAVRSSLDGAVILSILRERT